MKHDCIYKNYLGNCVLFFGLDKKCTNCKWGRRETEKFYKELWQLYGNGFYIKKLKKIVEND